MKQIPFFSALILAVISAFAQLGGIAHAYTHVPQVEVTLQDGNMAAHSVCDDCSSFAPVLSTAGTPTLLAFIAPPIRAIAWRAAAASLLKKRLNLAFRSRAPPLYA